jgi:hypothetical protein
MKSIHSTTCSDKICQESSPSHELCYAEAFQSAVKSLIFTNGTLAALLQGISTAEEQRSLFKQVASMPSVKLLHRYFPIQPQKVISVLQKVQSRAFTYPCIYPGAIIW